MYKVLQKFAEVYEYVIGGLQHVSGGS